MRCKNYDHSEWKRSLGSGNIIHLGNFNKGNYFFINVNPCFEHLHTPACKLTLLNGEWTHFP